MKKLFYVDESFDMGGHSYIARNSKAVNDREAVKNLNDMYEMLEKCQQKFADLGYYSRVEEIESLFERARGEQ